MQADRHFCRSKNLDRVRKLHFLFVDVVSELLFCCLSDLFCRYASEYFSALADFDCYGNLFVLNLFAKPVPQRAALLPLCPRVLSGVSAHSGFCGCLDAEFFGRSMFLAYPSLTFTVCPFYQVLLRLPVR